LIINVLGFFVARTVAKSNWINVEYTIFTFDCSFLFVCFNIRRRLMSTIVILDETTN